jgi:hypothetical protein
LPTPVYIYICYFFISGLLQKVVLHLGSLLTLPLGWCITAEIVMNSRQSKATCADVMTAVCSHHFLFGAQQILRTLCALNRLYRTLCFQENCRRPGVVLTELRDAGTYRKLDSGVGGPWSTCQY